jgi:hypothetical protein
MRPQAPVMATLIELLVAMTDSYGDWIGEKKDKIFYRCGACADRLL